jgi:FkbM family methyltransferase
MLHLVVAIVATNPCSFAYIELDSNRGDSLEAFVAGTPDRHVAAALKSAVPNWTVRLACVYGFEPNPKWTAKLQTVRQGLQPQVAAITLFTETAVVDDNRTQVQLFVDPSRLSEGSSIAFGGGRKQAIAVKAINLHEWLVSEFARSPLPIVIRADIEGFEYKLLSSLLSSGTATRFPRDTLNIAVEWHRFAEERSVGAEERSAMEDLDKSYHWVRGRKEPLIDSLEKQLHYWLRVAGIRLFY